MTNQKEPRVYRRTLFGGLIVGVLAVVSIVGWYWVGRTKPSEAERHVLAGGDPRLSYPTPYRNVRPEVKYVGDGVCAECHQEYSDSYAHHPMGRAMAPIALATPIERYSSEAKTPFTAGGLHYAVRREGQRVVHRERADSPDLEAIEADVAFAVGSGARARSYLVNHEGYLFQSPISWFPHAGRWDLSPSYELRNLHFTRAVSTACLFCHCSQVEHVAGTRNRFREPYIRGFAIGCERCHGPGELHAASRRAGDVPIGLDDTIVNPSRLETSLRDAVCQQCHLQGEQRIVGRGRSEFDFRPGLPLYPFLMDFVDARASKGDHKFVSAVEQMMASRCYTGSDGKGKLGCTSCHDPHSMPAQENKVAQYRDRCLKCHQDRGCAVPAATRRQTQTDDSCVACHMPKISSEVNHTSSTDHRIPRRAPKDSPRKPPPRSTPGPDDLVPFHAYLLGEQDHPEAQRNRGLAIVAMQDRGLPTSVARAYAVRALPLLDRAVERHADDRPAQEARADALWSLGRLEEAWAAYERALALGPDSERTVHGAANLALERKRNEDARGYFERAASLNPWNQLYQHGLAVVSFRRGEWRRGAEECRRALHLDPMDTRTRSLLVQCLLGLGDLPRATQEYQRIRGMTPANRQADLQRWFEEQQQRLGRP